MRTVTLRDVDEGPNHQSLWAYLDLEGNLHDLFRDAIDVRKRCFHDLGRYIGNHAHRRPATDFAATDFAEAPLQKPRRAPRGTRGSGAARPMAAAGASASSAPATR